MMKYSIIILLIALSSCSLEKRLAKYCPLCPDKIETVIEYRDTTIHDTIPGDTVSITDSLYCDSLGNVYSIRLSDFNKENMRLRTKLRNNRYKVVCETDTLYREKIIKGLDKIVTKTEKININVIPTWVYMLISFLLAVIAFLIISKIIKK